MFLGFLTLAVMESSEFLDSDAVRVIKDYLVEADEIYSENVVFLTEVQWFPSKLVSCSAA